VHEAESHIVATQDPLDLEPDVPVGARRVGRAATTLATAFRRLATYVIVAGLSLGAGLLVVALAAEYGYHPVRNASTWAGQPFRYAIAGTCADCHAQQQAAVAVAGHDAVNCQACHGPLQDHVTTERAAAGTGAGRPVLAEVIPSGPSTLGMCLACHDAVLGRPRVFPMISTAVHYGAVDCTVCHDPHGTSAVAPPEVRHSLDNLPDCLVCHAPGGVRPVTAAHPVVDRIDCLACHLRRGAAPR
jgi:hypothetical protein